MNDVNAVYLLQVVASALFGCGHKLENFKGRLSAQKAKIAIVLSDAQIAALERKHEDEVACGEIEMGGCG